jgi:hypothetical protein
LLLLDDTLRCKLYRHDPAKIVFGSWSETRESDCGPLQSPSADCALRCLRGLSQAQNQSLPLLLFFASLSQTPTTSTSDGRTLKTSLSPLPAPKSKIRIPALSLG